MPSCNTPANVITEPGARAYLAICWVVGLDEPCPTALAFLGMLCLLRHS